MTHRTARTPLAALVTAGVMALVLGSCGGSYSSSPTVPGSPPPPAATPTPAAGAVVIDIVGERGNMSFNPAQASLTAGQQVRWHNTDVITHTATQNGGAFSTGLIPPGGTSAPITVTAGAFGYHCEIHPSMVGALDVNP
jgi:plastocyanin